MLIRPMTATDVTQLDNIDPTFISRSYLHVELDAASGWPSYHFVEREVCPPEVAGDGNRFGSAEQAHIRATMEEGAGLCLVVEAEGSIVGLLEVEPRYWNNTAVVWNIQLSPTARGKGAGEELMQRAIAWAKAQHLRAIWLETQTNNLPACRFYARLGFKLAGLDTMFYTNEDVERGSVALFWYLPLEEQQ